MCRGKNSRRKEGKDPTHRGDAVFDETSFPLFRPLPGPQVPRGMRLNASAVRSFYYEENPNATSLPRWGLFYLTNN
jgi:hypothetical protein